MSSTNYSVLIPNESTGTVAYVLSSRPQIWTTDNGTQRGFETVPDFTVSAGATSQASLYAGGQFGSNRASQTINNTYAIYATTSYTGLNSTSTIQNAYGYYYDGGTVPSGTVLNSYGAYISNPIGGNNQIALYSDDISVGWTGLNPTIGSVSTRGPIAISTTGTTKSALVVSPYTNYPYGIELTGTFTGNDGARQQGLRLAQNMYTSTGMADINSFRNNPQFAVTTSGQTVTNLYGEYINMRIGTNHFGTFTNAYGLYVGTGVTGGTGNVTSSYGLYVEQPRIGSTNYCACFSGTTVMNTLATQIITYRLPLPNLSSQSWYKMGNWTDTSQGASMVIKFYGCSNYDSLYAGSNITTLSLRMLNQSATAPNIAGFVNTIGMSATVNNDAICQCKCVATTASGTTCQSWDIYVQLQPFLGVNAYYTVEQSTTSTWTHIMTASANPGNASTLIRSIFALASIGSPAGYTGGSQIQLSLYGGQIATYVLGPTLTSLHTSSYIQINVPLLFASTSSSLYSVYTTSFSATFQSGGGGGGSATVTVRLQSITSDSYTQVTLSIPLALFTTGSASYIQTSAAVIPSSYRPTSAGRVFIVRVSNGAANVSGLIAIETNGYITLYADVNGSNFPGTTANCGLVNNTDITYIV